MKLISFGYRCIAPFANQRCLLKVRTNPSNVKFHGRVKLYHQSFLSQLSQSRKITNSVPSYCQANEMDLSLKNCVPCNSKELKPMSLEVAEELQKQVPEWKISNQDGKLLLHREWKVKSFVKGLEFFSQIGNIAEAEGHHPDLHLVNWNNVKIDIWTHSVGGLTENDFILAAKISAFDADRFLRKKAQSKSSSVT